MTLQHHSWPIITGFALIASEERGKNVKEIVEWNSNYPSYRLGYRFRKPASRCAFKPSRRGGSTWRSVPTALPSNSFLHLLTFIINTLHARRLHSPPHGCSSINRIC